MALVYSYIRFSAKKQDEGDSLRRQTEDRDAWIAKNGHTLASMPLQDLGVPAFRGQNKHTGRLRAFLDAIATKRVKPGSILLVENLDRLSRQGVDEAFDLFKSILRAGVKIAVLRPYEHVYTEESLKDFVGLLIPLLYFHLAFIESKNKADRLRKVWEHKRDDAPSGKLFGKRRPSWVDWDEEEGKFKLNEGAEAVRFIFEKTAEGWGQRQLVRSLQATFKPIGLSGRWNSSFVQKVLADRAVLGELQPKTFNEQGERIPVGKPIPGYYPAVIDEGLWYRAQAAKARNLKKKGPNSGFVNLFTGLVWNAHDGYPMHVQTSPYHDGTRQRRLVSYGHLSSVPGADSVSVAYPEFETLMLRYLNEVNPNDLQPKDSGKALEAKLQELDGVEGRLAELQGQLENPEYANLPSVLSAVASLDKRKIALEKEVEKLKEEAHADQPLHHAKDVLRILADAAPEELPALRLRLRGLIAELVDRIYLKPEKHYGRVYWLAQVFFKAGLVKHVWSGPGWLEQKGMQTGFDVSELLFDLRDKETANSRSVFGIVAKEAAEPAAYTPPPVIPDTVGPASEIWLKLARSQMAKDSFRVVPSKIRRFVEFVGEDLPCEFLKRKWAKWIRWLKEEVKEGNLAYLTAKVTYSRSREFVRWLIGQGKLQALDGLDVSAEKVLG